MIAQFKIKKCKFCKKAFQPLKQFQITCGYQCAIDYAVSSRVKKEKHDHQIKVKAAKTRAEWLKEAQTVFNKFIRLRDDKEPCISCQRHHTGQYHAGHYRSVGSMPTLRFNELNNHKQCAPCNNHLSGNIVNYRINLIKKIGVDKVEWLEGSHDPAKYTIDDIKQIIQHYKQAIKQIESQHE